MFPKLLQRLFANEGAGPKLRTDILPLDDKTLGVNGEGAVAVQLSDAVNSASSTTAASSNAVKTAYDAGVAAAATANAAQSAANAAKATADTAQDTADAAKTTATAAQSKANSAYTEATKAASTSAAGRVQLSDAVNSESSTTAATSKAVKAAWDKAVAATNSAGKAHIAETWHSGASWYRVWSDGFIEQGGEIPRGTEDTWGNAFSITFPKSFTAMPRVFRQACSADQAAYRAMHGSITAVTKTGFKYGTSYIDTDAGSWIAMGY